MSEELMQDTKNAERQQLLNDKTYDKYAQPRYHRSMGIDFVLLFALAGWVIGSGINRLWLWRIRRAHIQKPLYNLVEELTPGEFGYILDGRIGRKELIAEIVMLKMQGHIDLIRNEDDNNFQVINISSSAERLTPIQASILKKIGRSPTETFDLQETFETSVKESLINKDWVFKTDPDLRLGHWLSRLLRKKHPVLLRIAVAAVGIIWVLATLTGASPETTVQIFNMVFGIVMIPLTLILLVLFLVGIMFRNAGLLLNPTPKYKKSWKDVRGVYDYLWVSGMDIFTPDYDTLTLKDVDKLYPYVVAAGLDKKIVRLIY